MTYFLRNRFFTNKLKSSNGNPVYSAEDYNDMFVIPKKLMRLTGVQMAHEVSEFPVKFWRLFYWFEIVCVALAVPAEFLSMIMTVMNSHSFEDASKVFRMMPCMGSCALSIFKSLKIKCNKKIFENLFYELRDMWPRTELTEDESRIISPALRQFNIIVKGYYWCNNALLVSFLSPPYILTIGRYLGYDAPMILSFEFWLPFDPLKPIRYEFMEVFQTWLAVVVIWTHVISDILFCTFLTHITMQFELLAQRTRRLVRVPVDSQLVDSYPLANINREWERDKTELLDACNKQDKDIRLHQELIDIVNIHRKLIRLAGDVESMYSFVLLINFMNSSIIICFCGFCCVLVEKWNEVAYKSFLVTALSQTWLLCWYGQKLLDSSVDVAKALYECGWYDSSKRIKNAILIMLLRSQKGISVTTYGFSTVSLASYSTIIKTSWSYFTLLLNCYTATDDSDTAL